MTDIDIEPAGTPSLEPQCYVPAEIGHEPTTAVEALRSARALLAEEGRWTQFIYYDADVRETDKPFCGSWRCCAVGALQVVTLGVRYHQFYNHWKPLQDGYTFPGSEWGDRVDIYNEALASLDQAAGSLGCPCGSAIYYNDRNVRTRDEVLHMFDVAIEAAA